jgi:adenylate kinase
MGEDTNKQITAKIKVWLGSGSINIFGRPLSGKDTQAKFLSQLLDAPIIGGGDIIRNSREAQELNHYISDGKLAPQQEYLDLIIPYLSRDEFKNRPLVLSSLGRWHGEEEPILSAAKKSGHPVKGIIYLSVPDEIIYQRIELLKQRGDRELRADDRPEAVSVRLKEFNAKTIPVIDYYEDKGILTRIDGTQTPQKVSQAIVSVLIEMSKRS